ncbi:MAG: hypothetical protein LBP96_01050 [Bacteroidales bacterium]|jgi:hypothetical protein|nr:hypothetical protein [Bacteroidales bacterium]
MEQKEITIDRLGTLKFDEIGWKTRKTISFFGRNEEITVKIAAYEIEDGITAEQLSAVQDFIENEAERLKTVERLLTEHVQEFLFLSADEAPKRYTPALLIFEEDGSYALSCDVDVEDLLEDEEKQEDYWHWEENAAVVCIKPDEVVMVEDEYL